MYNHITFHNTIMWSRLSSGLKYSPYLIKGLRLLSKFASTSAQRRKEKIWYFWTPERNIKVWAGVEPLFLPIIVKEYVYGMSNIQKWGTLLVETSSVKIDEIFEHFITFNWWIFSTNEFFIFLTEKAVKVLSKVL